MPDPVLTVNAARDLLSRSGVPETLSAFGPRWVGSIPLDIHGQGADIDICCSAPGGLDAFRTALESRFGDRYGAIVQDNVHAGEASVIAKFTVEDTPFEVFGRTRPVETHESYIHWLAEHRLLALASPRLREDVRAAKRSGLKTEPAFAHCLGLGGDPYVEILKLASPGDAALSSVLERSGYAPG